MIIERVFNKKFIRFDLKFGDINWEKVMIKQYEFEKDERVWRIFFNGYVRNGFVIFDEEFFLREEFFKVFEEFKLEVVGEKILMVQEFIEESMSWNNVFFYF